MKHIMILSLVSALVLWAEYMQAHPTHQAHHPARRAGVDVGGRDMPTDTTRKISWDPVNVPVEPPKGTCALTSNMTIKADPGANICVPYLLDTTSIFSWTASKNMACFDTDRNGSDINGAECVGPTMLGLLDAPPGTAQTHSSGMSRALTVSGTAISTNITNFGGFRDVPYTVIAAQKLTFPRNSDPVFHDFGRTPVSPIGILRFGQLKKGSVGDYAAYLSNYSVRSSPLMEAISSPGGPIPMWTLAMPSGDDKGVVVIGGWASAATVPVMNWDLTYVPTVEVSGPADNGYYIPVLGLDTLTPKYGLANKTTPITPKDTEAGTYLIDSLSNVIRTSNAVAQMVAASFTSPGWADPHSGAWYVDCTATPPVQNYGIRLQGRVNTRAFLISKWNMKVALTHGNCVSAFQPPDADGKYKLGWPFLKNTVITFNLRDVPTSLNITQRVLGGVPDLQLVD